MAGNRSIAARFRDRIRMQQTDSANARSFASVNRVTSKKIIDKTRPVLFFNASTRLNRTSLNAAFAWVTANSLQQTGTPVHFAVCKAGLQPCLLETAFGTDLCSGCQKLSDEMYVGLDTTYFTFREDRDVMNELEGLDEAGLAGYVHDGVPLGELTLPSLRWILRRHHLDDEAAPLHRKFIRSAYSTYIQAKELIEKLDPRAVVVFNGLQYPEATVKWLGKHLGIPTYTHEIGLMPYTAIFTEGEATACPITLPDDFEMTDKRNERLDEYLSKRMKGSFTTAGIQFWPEMQALTPEFWDMARPFRQIVPVFTNVVFDTSQKHANVVFDNMFDWLDHLKPVFENNLDTLFVIRAHPDECRPGKESRETVSDWVKQNHIPHMRNVLFVGPDQYFSSYELINNAKFVMVYNSTIGLEAAIMGAGVLCAGRSRYTQVPLSWFPQTVDAYMQKLDELLRSDEVSVPASFKLTARKFMYYQFFHTALSFEEFIEPDGIWNGYVRIKPFPLSALQENLNLRVIREGILNGTPFVLPDEEHSAGSPRSEEDRG